MEHGRKDKGGNEPILRYNFVRPLFEGGRPDQGELARGCTESHAKYREDRCTGTIDCRLELLAPFFIPDPRKRRPENLGQGHDNVHHRRGYFTLDRVAPTEAATRRGRAVGPSEWRWFPDQPDRDETEPAIPGASLRGMVRSVFEALTDSCLSVFDPEVERDPHAVPVDEDRKERLIPHLRPCTDPERLCPACRVFGWVEREDDSSVTSPTGDRQQARASHVRFGHGRLVRERFEADGEERTFDVQRVTLPALMSPHPEHEGAWRHYHEVSSGSSADRDGDGAGIDADAPPRGRKFYRHDPAVWREESVPEGGTHSPYNRTVHLVEGEPTFAFTVRFANLSDFELGALLTALRLCLPFSSDFNDLDFDEGDNTVVQELREADYSPDRPLKPAHQVGTGRSLGLGTCRITGTELTLAPGRARYGTTMGEADIGEGSNASPTAGWSSFVGTFWGRWSAAPGRDPRSLADLVEMLRLDPPTDDVAYRTGGALPPPLEERNGARYS